MDDNKRLANLTRPLEEFFANLGDSRPKALNEVKELQVMSRVLLQNEAARMDRKLGEDHPRSRSIMALLEQNLENINALEVESEIAAIHPPKVEENQTLIHGRVVDNNGHGLQGLFVSMADEGGKTLHFLGRSETDASGYHALVIGPDDIKKASKAAEDGVFLMIHTKKGELVHREFDPLRIAEGDRRFVEVVLDLEDLIAGKRRLEYQPEAGHEQKQDRETYEEGSESSDGVELEREARQNDSE